MEDQTHIEEFICELGECEAMDEAWAAYICALNRYGVEHACYGFMATQPRKAISTEVLTLSNHRDAFIEAYMAGGHPDHDWSVNWSMTHTKPQRWNTPEILERLSPQERKTEELAYDFGLYEGIVIPIRGAMPSSWGGIGLAAPNLDAAEWGRVLQSHQATLEVLSQGFHEHVHSQGYFDHFHLSDRESEVLKWITCGLNKHEIADKLNISSRTAEVHIYRVRRKLGCVNDAQVTAKALVFNLVSA